MWSDVVRCGVQEDPLLQTLIRVGSSSLFWPGNIRTPFKSSKYVCRTQKINFLKIDPFLKLQLNYRLNYRKFCQKQVIIQIQKMACHLEMIYTSFRTAICTLVLQILILSTLDGDFRSLFHLLFHYFSLHHEKRRSN